MMNSDSSNSLYLLDELGRGTGTLDGYKYLFIIKFFLNFILYYRCSIAKAVIDELIGVMNKQRVFFKTKVYIGFLIYFFRDVRSLQLTTSLY